MRWVYAALAHVFVALALLGLILPGLPTTPFVLLAAWAASRGSRRLQAWLHGHPRFGPALADWRERRAVSPGAKATGVMLLAVSWTVLLCRGTRGGPLALVTVLLLGMAVFLLTRPSAAGRQPDAACD